MERVRGSFLHVLSSLDPDVLLVGDNRSILASERAMTEALAATDGRATLGLFETSVFNGRIVISRIDGSGRIEPVLAQRFEHDVASSLDESAWLR